MGYIILTARLLGIYGNVNRPESEGEVLAGEFLITMSYIIISTLPGDNNKCVDLAARILCICMHGTGVLFVIHDYHYHS